MIYKTVFSKKNFWIAVIVIFFILNFLVIIFFKPLTSWTQKIFTADWYAVHLNNGQVYFGHIKSIKDNSIKLSEVYFLESFEPQTQENQGQNFQIQAAPQKKFTLVQRGSDNILATDHVLFINPVVVLFWEQLNNNSEIVKMIEEGRQNDN